MEGSTVSDNTPAGQGGSERRNEERKKEELERLRSMERCGFYLHQMPDLDLCISARVDTDVIAASMPMDDVTIVTYQLKMMMRVPFRFKASIREMMIHDGPELEETPFLVPSPNEQVAHSEPVTEAQGSTARSMTYPDEHVENFIEKLDAKEKNQVDFPNFKGLKEELETRGIEHVPTSLAPIHDRIEKAYGDITADSKLSACMVRGGYILLCSVIKEMDDLKLDQIDENKMLFWRDAINNGLMIGIKCDFAIDHLKNIAFAYYGRGSDQEEQLECIQQRMPELNIQLCASEWTHARKLEEHNSEVRKQCLHAARKFSGKPLSTDLFIYPFPSSN
ncbi:hypothetical protein PTKIN_Ptkin04bG0170800 [Pterospermum kingtungense]